MKRTAGRLETEAQRVEVPASAAAQSMTYWR